MWEKQWELFAADFREGKAHIDLSPYGYPKVLQLYPGPGFGDFSHATTQLMLELMSFLLSNNSLYNSYLGNSYHPGDLNFAQTKNILEAIHIIDIGCGSGVLSLAAAYMGVEHIYGFDIDTDAVSHAQKNASLYSGLSKPIFSIEPPKEISYPSLLLMNMIHLEQQEVWEKLAQRLQIPTVLIASGILSENISSYLKWCQKHHWKLQYTVEKQGWNGFIFTIPCFINDV